MLQNLKIIVRKKSSSLLAEPTFLVTLGTRAKSSTSTFSSSRQKLRLLLAGKHTRLVSIFLRVISLEILAYLRILHPAKRPKWREARRDGCIRRLIWDCNYRTRMGFARGIPVMKQPLETTMYRVRKTGIDGGLKELRFCQL